jgi:threonine/homoserine/homoserine lactone efflux protein
MAGDGCVVALLNPKTYIFMAAFLPQFLGPDGSWPRAAVLGLFGPCFAACTDMGYALAAGSLKGRLDRGFAWTRWIAAPCFAALGAWALLGK